jgi:hypothetical protein
MSGAPRMKDNTVDNTMGATGASGAGDDAAFRVSLHHFGYAVRLMVLRRDVLEASAGTLFQRMLGAGTFDEVLVRATQGVAADWLCRGNDDATVRATAFMALRLLDDAYWVQLALDLLDAYFSYATLL